MTPTISGLLIAALAFAIALGGAKFIAVRRQRRQQEHGQQLGDKGHSRQVRRARALQGPREALPTLTSRQRGPP